MAADAPTFMPDFDRRSRSVAADLDEIFRHAPPARPPADGPQRVRVFGGAAPSRAARTSAAGLGALAAVGLLGLAVGAALTRPPGPPQPPPSAAVAVAPPPAVALPPPVAAAPAVAVPATPAPSAAAIPLAAPAPRAAPAARAVAPARKPARAAPDGCQHLRGDARARCAYPAVLAADRRLRTAYARATRAGVPRATLAAYRSRWAGLRRRATDEPTRVIAGYAAMTGELSRLTQTSRPRG